MRATELLSQAFNEVPWVIAVLIAGFVYKLHKLTKR